MEADDTIAAAAENAIFEEVDDAGEDVTDPFADLDDNRKWKSLELSLVHFLLLTFTFSRSLSLSLVLDWNKIQSYDKKNHLKVHVIEKNVNSRKNFF